MSQLGRRPQGASGKSRPGVSRQPNSRGGVTGAGRPQGSIGSGFGRHGARQARAASSDGWASSARSGLAGEQVEGHHAVRQLLVSRRRRVHLLWAQEACAAGSPVGQVVELARRQGVRVELKSPEEIMAAAGTDAPQGVVAWAGPLPEVPLEEMLVRANGCGLVVVLDGVSDPGNLGSVLRVAACAGAAGVVLGRHRSAPLSPAALKAAAGAAEVVPIAREPGVPGALAKLRAAGWWTVGLDPQASEDVWSAPLLDEPVALVLGSEGRGLSRLARNRCDSLVAVPVAKRARDEGVSSLNVATACAVGCFEVARRRAGSLKRTKPPLTS